MTNKQLANLQARAALAGVVLQRSTGDTGRPVFIVTVGAATWALESLEAVEEWLRSGEPAGALL